MMLETKGLKVSFRHQPTRLYFAIGDLVSKETVCCIGGKVKH